MKGRCLKYENSVYWTNLYREYGGALKATGHPLLSEKLNELKYKSESRTFLESLKDIGENFLQSGKSKLSIQDVGAGFGYWTRLAQRHFGEQGFQVDMTALDISREALDILQKDIPSVKLVQRDLKKIDPELFIGRFDLVFCCYCLHHLINVEDFLNALHFVSNSVKPGGFLIIMDPVLTLPFSKFDAFDFFCFKGNGIPRHVYFLEDILYKKGFRRERIKPAVSFVLNGNIESFGLLTYVLANTVWKILCKSVYQSESLVRALSGPLFALDGALKTMKVAFSSSVCVYRRLDTKWI